MDTSPRPRCLDETRLDHIDAISDWAAPMSEHNPIRVFTGGTFRLMNMRYMRLAVLTDGKENTLLTIRVPHLHDHEILGDKVGA